MRFHVPSFLLGVAVGAGVSAERERLRPVWVELGAVAVHAYRVAKGLVAREREELEDLVEEIADRFREKVRGPRQSNGHAERNPSTPS